MLGPEINYYLDPRTDVAKNPSIQSVVVCSFRGVFWTPLMSMDANEITIVRATIENRMSANHVTLSQIADRLT
jgi:hypothetical protein